MTATADRQPIFDSPDAYRRMPAPQAPFVRAPEATRTILLVTAAAACGPLLGGIVFFGWRAASVTVIAVVSCVLIEWLYDRVTRTPGLLARTHAVLTGLLLGLTLPPFAPWYATVIASAFAIIVGKAIFGGVGHFVWQPALMGRLAVAVMLPMLAAGPSSIYEGDWPVLARPKIVVGDVMRFEHAESLARWRTDSTPGLIDAFLGPRPETQLAALTRDEARYSAIGRTPVGVDRPLPTALEGMPPLPEVLIGAIPGGIGETSAVLITMAGLYLIYRNYIKWQLPLAILLSAGVAIAIAPVQLVTDRPFVVWWPVAMEGLDVGAVYLAYQLTTGGLFLAAFFLATEMTCRPVTTGGQVLFGAGIGVLATVLRLYTAVPVPAYVAVLVMNTFTQSIDRLWRPRIFGRRRWPFRNKFFAKA